MKTRTPGIGEDPLRKGARTGDRPRGRNNAGNWWEQDAGRRLGDADFLLRFASAVNASLEMEEVFLAAARCLYDRLRFSLIAFRLPLKGSGSHLAFASVSPEACRREEAELRRQMPAVRLDEIRDYRSLGLRNPRIGGVCGASLHLDLPCHGGAVTILWGREKAGALSRNLLERLGEVLATAMGNALEYERVRELSMQDGLTGLLNRRVFEEMLEIEAKRREPRPLSLMLIDLDDFKKINDTLGHQAGDMVLANFARFLRENCREGDVVARYGGEEFAVLFLGTAAAVAREIGERLRRRLEEACFVYEGRRLKLTASIGMAYCDGNGENVIREVVRRADHALYAAKNGGKNRLCVAGTPVLVVRNSGRPAPAGRHAAPLTLVRRA